MSAGTQLHSQWQGRVIEGKFPLLRELGKSDHSVVFLSEDGEKEPQKAAIKLVPADAVERAYGNNEEAQLARWREAASLSHPHLIKLLQFGRCDIDGTCFLYVATEYAEENLAEILPSRALSADEAQEMLRPAAAALDTVHQAGYVHGHIKPSNILAAGDQLKISIDGLCQAGEPGGAVSAYDAPEKAESGVSAEGDIWSLGRTLMAVLTQNEPIPKSETQDSIAIPGALPQPLHEIVRSCLVVDPHQRATAAQILRCLDGSSLPHAVSAPTVSTSAASSREMRVSSDKEQVGRKKATRLAGAFVLLLGVIIVGRLLWRRPQVPESTSSPPVTTSNESPAGNSPTPFAKRSEDSPSGPRPGSVLHQVMPEVSPGALRTIQGRIRVSVQVDVDSNGSVASAKLAHGGPSRYFADRALVAARKWKFNPPRSDQRLISSVWMLHFQFRRSSVEVSPSEVKP
jgi:TonB family protein